MAETAPTESFVLITGAAGGLGRTFAAECAARGWHLLLTDLHANPSKRWPRVCAASLACGLWLCPAT